jgi:hypothetical protein
VAHGLIILARNYLDVYPYDHWSDKVMRGPIRGGAAVLLQPVTPDGA